MAFAGGCRGALAPARAFSRITLATAENWASWAGVICNLWRKVAMLASTVGGYLAGRLRNRWAGVHHDELYFRDTAHGFLAWAFATVLTAAVLGGATTHILAGASAGLAPAAASSANSAGNPTDVYVEKLLRVDADIAPAAAGPAPLGDAAGSSRAGQLARGSSYYGTRGELGRVIASGMSKGDLTTKDLIVVKDTPHPHPLPQGERGSKRFPSPLVGNLRANDPPIEARWSLQAVGREGEGEG